MDLDLLSQIQNFENKNIIHTINMTNGVIVCKNFFSNHDMNERKGKQLKYTQERCEKNIKIGIILGGSSTKELIVTI